MKKELQTIAKVHLRLDTLDTRKSDRLDFKEQAVWNIKLALEEAYRAGLMAGLKRATELYEAEVLVSKDYLQYAPQGPRKRGHFVE